LAKIEGALAPRAGGRGVVKFDPEKTHVLVPAYEAAIEAAQRMRDWNALFEAVDWMIAEQRDFVTWWSDAVGVRESAGDNQHKRSNAEQRSTLTRKLAEGKTKIKQQQVSRWRTYLKRPDYRAKLAKGSYSATWSQQDAPDRADLQTGEMEWYTPAVYIEKARRVLGAIDLDPASCAQAQDVVGAEKFFTKADDGLAQKWHGRVWLNPPYAGGIVAAFAAKMVDEWTRGDLVGAFMLTNAYTETAWWHALARASSAICLTRGRIKFESPHGEKCAPTNGQSFFYFGTEIAKLRAEFADVGLILRREKAA
jgi:hypothetical protein